MKGSSDSHSVDTTIPTDPFQMLLAHALPKCLCYIAVGAWLDTHTSLHARLAYHTMTQKSNIEVEKIKAVG
jgi:hypothetical protein